MITRAYPNDGGGRQLRWIHSTAEVTTYNLVSELGTMYQKLRRRDVKTRDCDELNEREEKTFNVTGERLYAGSKSAVRRIPYFEADRDRKLCVVTWVNERKGAGSGILSRLSRAAQATRATKTKAIALSGSCSKHLT